MAVKIKIPIEELRKRKLFLATPMYGGNCSGMYARSVADLAALCANHGISLQLYFLFNESLITRARAYCTDEFLRSEASHLIFIDSDIGFDPDDVDRLRSHQLPIVCGIYPKKGTRSLACHSLPDTKQFVFGKAGGLVEVKYAGTGFLYVRNEVYTTIQEKLDLPLCNEQFGERPMIPYFQPFVHQDASGAWYLAEDFAFCERARQSGYRIMADTRIRLHHVGSYRYSWEDAGKDTERFDTFTMQLT